MKREQFIRELEEAGDAIINFLNSKKKVKYVTATLDFSTPYIAERNKPEKVIPNSVIVFSWDEDKFKHIRYDRVISIIPLQTAIEETFNG